MLAQPHLRCGACPAFAERAFCISPDTSRPSLLDADQAGRLATRRTLGKVTAALSRERFRPVQQLYILLQPLACITMNRSYVVSTVLYDFVRISPMRWHPYEPSLAKSCCRRKTPSTGAFLVAPGDIRSSDVHVYQ
jgi:hypothetical protein